MTTIFVSGLNHRTASIELRERFAVEADTLYEVIGQARDHGVVAEAVALSTCNRVELYGAAASPGEARDTVFGLLCRKRGLDFASVQPLLYTKADVEAVVHCFRVASSLDSMIPGEPQILGQTKDAFDVAVRRGTTGPILHRLMAQAFAVAKRVRTETELGHHAVSVPFAAVELARKIFGGLGGKSALLIGAGAMGELAARHLVSQGASPLHVANRTKTRALELARALGGTAVDFEAWRAVLPDADVVITATGAPEPVIRRRDIDNVLLARRPRPLLLVDLAVPRAVEPGLNDLDGVFCFDIDDLEQVVEANLHQRQREAQRAEALVARAAKTFVSRLGDLAVVPTIVSLREKLEAIRQAEVTRSLARIPDASLETRAAIDALSIALVNKILHTPTVKLRESSRGGVGWIPQVSELFGLTSAAERGTPTSGGAAAGEAACVSA